MERSQSRKVSSGHGSSRHAHGRHRHHSHRESPQPHGQPRYVRECSCGNGLACSGMAQAFRLLGDPRCYYVELPRYRKDPPAYKYIFRNNLRAAYIRHLVKQNPKLDSAEFDSPHRRYVALHHFHPTVVRTFYNNPLTKAQKHKVPISITEHELEELDMELSLEDRILSFSGKPTGGYFFVPNYSHSQAHEDLKALIRATRMSKEFPTSKQQKIKEESSIKDAERQSIPKNIDISDTDDTCFKEVPHSLSEISKDQNSPSPKKQTPPKSTPENHDDDDNENHDDDDDDDDSSTEHVPRNASNQEDDQDFKLREEDTPAESDFDNLWDDETPGEVGGIQTIIEADEADHSESTDGHDHVAELHNSTKDHIPQTIIETNEEEDGEGQKEPTTVKPINKSTPPARDADHPWGTPKYRKNRPDLVKIKSSGPAQFIDPTVTSDIRPSASIDSEEEPPVAPSQALNLDSAQATQSVTKVVPKDNFGSDKGIATPDLSSDRPGVLSADPPGKTPQQPLRVKTSLSPPHRRKAAEYTDFDETKSAASDDSDKAVQLKHQLPGTDPTLRIQMHNDLIAWESKRRSDLTKDLEFNREQWKAAREILEDCIAEVEFAERLVLGFSKAGILFADALEAMYDDNFLDDSGNTVSNSFVQNRLAKRRSVHEYSIESASKAFTAQAGQSTLLNSIIESQLALANIFKESSQHMQEEILPEINEIRADIQASARGLESLGDSMIAELKRSEIEVKNIWGTYDIRFLDETSATLSSFFVLSRRFRCYGDRGSDGI